MIAAARPGSAPRPVAARLAVVCIIGLVGCAVAGTPRPPGALAASPRARSTAAAPPEDVAAAVAGVSALGLDLYRTLVAETPTSNLVLSPWSIADALAMTSAGAAAGTREAFDRTLRVTLPEARFHRAMNDLERALASRGRGAIATGGQPFRLDVTNQLFADLHTPFEAPFLDVLAREYGAGARLLDFGRDPDGARRAIDAWVERKTGGKIRDLLTPGAITPQSRAVLVDAVWFDAAWATRFDPAATRDAPFRRLDGTEASVRMMSRRVLPARAATVGGVEVIALPYSGEELSMVLLVPPVGAFPAFEQRLSRVELDRYLAALALEPLALSMPRFEVRTSAGLRGALSAIGLEAAFDPRRADFSRMSPAPGLALSDVVHQALAIVDENGTVAAAATAAVVGVTAVLRTRAVVVDRPFAWLVRDDATGAVLFLGRYVGP